MVHSDDLKREHQDSRTTFRRHFPSNFGSSTASAEGSWSDISGSGAVAGNRSRKWTINGDFIALRPYGVARYAREVTAALDQFIGEGHPLTQDLNIELVAPKKPVDEQSPKSIPIKIVPEYRKPRMPQFWVQAQLPRHVSGGLISFCNLAPVTVKRQIVCIHDMHIRLMPESYGAGFRWAHRIVLPMLGKRVERITTVSELSASHLVQYGIAPSSKIEVTYNGADHVRNWDASRSNLTNRSGRPFVFCLGRRQSYKNTDLMLQLAPQLDRMGLDLWMAGDIEANDLSSKFNVAGNIRFLGHIQDDDFAFALERAACFVFPSRIEGFGLPAVEAMARGCPVVASTSPCLPEVCGDAALYADPDDLSQWVDAIQTLQNDARFRQNLTEAGFKQARKYSWRTIAITYLKLMADIDRTA